MLCRMPSGQVAFPNPIEVIEQITYLLFIRVLDNLQTNHDRQANRFGSAIDYEFAMSSSE